MSQSLWQSLPAGFLKKKYPAWDRLDQHGLEIEHDHDPEHGDGDRPTIYNIRGLVCRGCNWQLMMYEKKERGEYTGWVNFYCGITERSVRKLHLCL
jgi:hypothetical protein